MSESSEVVSGGTSAAPAPDVLAASTPVEEGRGGATPKDALLGHEGSTLK